MSNIKVAELFYSIQGEGRYMGVPSVFLRTFGCNFTCAGFGMPPGERSIEADQVAGSIFSDPDRPVKYEDLPLVTTGCDSYASWHPAFKHLSPMMSTDDIANKICELLPFKTWKDEHLVITGGEPLLGWQRSYPDLLNHPKMGGLQHITFETNGTQELSDSFASYLQDWDYIKDWEGITFSVSPKLSISGEMKEHAIRPDIVTHYEDIGYTYLKFVVVTEADVTEALDVIEEYRDAGFNGPVYLMPCGGVESVYSLNNKRVAELAMKHGLRYSDRLHLPLFGNSWGT